MEYGVLDGCLTVRLGRDRLLLFRFELLPLEKGLVAIDHAAFLRDTALRAVDDVQADDVVLVEPLSPPLRDSVLDLVLDHGSVWALGQGLRQRLLVQLVELIVKLGDHLLNVSALLLCVDLLEDGNFDILL